MCNKLTKTKKKNPKKKTNCRLDTKTAGVLCARLALPTPAPVVRYYYVKIEKKNDKSFRLKMIPNRARLGAAVIREADF